MQFDDNISKHNFDNQTLLKIMQFTGRVGAATVLQIGAHCFQGDEKSAAEILERLVFQHRLLGRKENLSIPRRCGAGKITIYYLTATGKKWLEANAPDFHKFYSKKPNDKIYQKHYVFHDLMINKALLWFEANYDVLGFVPERSIRSEILRARYRVGDSAPNGFDLETMGDFRILLREMNDAEKLTWYECEVSVSLDAEQIAAKPDDLIWFVVDETDADVIREVKGDRALAIIVLGQLNSDKFPSEEWTRRREKITNLFNRNDIQPRKKSEQKVFQALKLVGGIATASAVAAVLGLDRSGISRTLNDLEKCHYLMSQSVSLFPGRKIGVPQKLYSLPEFDFLSLHERQKKLVASLCITNLHNKNLWLEKCHSEHSLLKFNHREAGSSSALFVVIDDLDLPVENIKERFEQVSQLQGSDETVVQVWHQDRFKAMSNVRLGSFLIDFTRPNPD